MGIRSSAVHNVVWRSTLRQSYYGNRRSIRQTQGPGLGQVHAPDPLYAYSIGVKAAYYSSGAGSPLVTLLNNNNKFTIIINFIEESLLLLLLLLLSLLINIQKKTSYYFPHTHSQTNILIQYTIFAFPNLIIIPVHPSSPPYYFFSFQFLIIIAFYFNPHNTFYMFIFVILFFSKLSF